MIVLYLLLINFASLKTTPMYGYVIGTEKENDKKTEQFTLNSDKKAWEIVLKNFKFVDIKQPPEFSNKVGNFSSIIAEKILDDNFFKIKQSKKDELDDDIVDEKKVLIAIIWIHKSRNILILFIKIGEQNLLLSDFLYRNEKDEGIWNDMLKYPLDMVTEFGSIKNKIYIYKGEENEIDNYSDNKNFYLRLDVLKLNSQLSKSWGIDLLMKSLNQ